MGAIIVKNHPIPDSKGVQGGFITILNFSSSIFCSLDVVSLPRKNSMLDRECDPKFGGSPSPSGLKNPAIFITSSFSRGSRFSSLIYCETASKIGSLLPDKKWRIQQNESLLDIRNILYFFTLIIHEVRSVTLFG